MSTGLTSKLTYRLTGSLVESLVYPDESEATQVGITFDGLPILFNGLPIIYTA